MKKIVIIDDDLGLLKVYEFFISKQGHEVIACRDSQEAMQFIVNRQPADLFIIDVELPDMSGIELVEQIRSNDQYIDTPIIISSGYEQYRNDFKTWLADDYLVKQADLSHLQEKINLLLQAK